MHTNPLDLPYLKLGTYHRVKKIISEFKNILKHNRNQIFKIHFKELNVIDLGWLVISDLVPFRILPGAELLDCQVRMEFSTGSFYTVFIWLTKEYMQSRVQHV